MSKQIAKVFLIVVLVLVGLTGCETEIDIIAPKRDVTIIYGLLEANKTTHFIRINKAFVGEESAANLASQPGINEYSDSELSAIVREKNQDGTLTGVNWEIQDTIINSKDEGAFDNSANKVYYFNAALKTDKIYELICNVNIEGEEEKQVTAETEIIGSQNAQGDFENVQLFRPRLVGASSDPSQADRAEVEFVGNLDYINDYEVTWSRAAGGSSYTSYYRFYYTEVDKQTGARTRDSLLFPIGVRRVEDPTGGGEVNFGINPEEFFISIDQNISDIDTSQADFFRYASDTLQFFLEIADNTLATYIEVNQPATEIVQEQPEFTNVNNGIGIFASRLVVTTRNPDRPFEGGRVFRARTLEELLYSNAVNPEFTYETINKGFSLETGRCNDAIQDCR